MHPALLGMVRLLQVRKHRSRAHLTHCTRRRNMTLTRIPPPSLTPSCPPYPHTAKSTTTTRWRLGRKRHLHPRSRRPRRQPDRRPRARRRRRTATWRAIALRPSRRQATMHNLHRMPGHARQHRRPRRQQHPHSHSKRPTTVPCRRRRPSAAAAVRPCRMRTRSRGSGRRRNLGQSHARPGHHRWPSTAGRKKSDRRRGSTKLRRRQPHPSRGFSKRPAVRQSDRRTLLKNTVSNAIRLERALTSAVDVHSLWPGAATRQARQPRSPRQPQPTSKRGRRDSGAWPTHSHALHDCVRAQTRTTMRWMGAI